MELQIPVRNHVVSASLEGEGPTVVALGHGAGGTRRMAFLQRVSAALVASGRRAMLFNFPYSEACRRIPDPAPLLEETIACVAEAARDRDARHVVLGGKSMGGRMASMAVAHGLTPADGLAFLGYPLHAPGREDRLRDAHLPDIGCPMLFLQGTRDAFARWDLVESVTGRLGPRATLVRLPGGDHSFVAPRGASPSSKDLEAQLLSALLAWLDRLAV